MPQHKSSEKRLRQTAKANAYNRAVRSRINTASKKLTSAKGDAVVSALNNVYSELDHAVKVGVIHKNKAANQKSRLAIKAKTASSAAPVSAKTGATKPAAAVSVKSATAVKA